MQAIVIDPTSTILYVAIGLYPSLQDQDSPISTLHYNYSISKYYVSNGTKIWEEILPNVVNVKCLVIDSHENLIVLGNTNFNNSMGNITGFNIIKYTKDGNLLWKYDLESWQGLHLELDSHDDIILLSQEIPYGMEFVYYCNFYQSSSSISCYITACGDHSIVATTCDTAFSSDPALSLRDMSGNTLVSNDNYCGLGPQLEYTIPSSKVCQEYNLVQSSKKSTSYALTKVVVTLSKFYQQNITKLSGINGDLMWSESYNYNKDFQESVVKAMTFALNSKNEIITVNQQLNTNSGYYNVVISKFSTTGKSLLWMKTLGGLYTVTPVGVVVDSFDDIYIAGTTMGNLFANTSTSITYHFDDYATNANVKCDDSIIYIQLKRNQQAMITICAFGCVGNPALSNSFNVNFLMTSTYQYLATTSSKTAYVSHYYKKSNSAGCYDDVVIEILENNLTGFAENIFITKYRGASGTLEWAQQFGSGRNETVSSLQIDDNNAIYLTGSTLGNLYHSNQGNNDVFMHIFDPSGAAISLDWQYGLSGNDICTSASVSSSGDILVGGATNSSLYEHVSSHGRYDWFMSNPILCPAGYYNDEAHVSPCIPCPPHTKAPTAGSSSCIECPRYSTSEAGSVSCTLCYGGYFHDGQAHCLSTTNSLRIIVLPLAVTVVVLLISSWVNFGFTLAVLTSSSDFLSDILYILTTFFYNRVMFYLSVTSTLFPLLYLIIDVALSSRSRQLVILYPFTYLNSAYPNNSILRLALKLAYSVLVVIFGPLYLLVVFIIGYFLMQTKFLALPTFSAFWNRLLYCEVLCERSDPSIGLVAPSSVISNPSSPTETMSDCLVAKSEKTTTKAGINLAMLNQASFVEVLSESFPQLALQYVNNVLMDRFTTVAVISAFFSLFFIASAIYRVIYYKCYLGLKFSEIPELFRPMPERETQKSKRVAKLGVSNRFAISLPPGKIECVIDQELYNRTNLLVVAQSNDLIRFRIGDIISLDRSPNISIDQGQITLEATTSTSISRISTLDMILDDNPLDIYLNQQHRIIIRLPAQMDLGFDFVAVPTVFKNLVVYKVIDVCNGSVAEMSGVRVGDYIAFLDDFPVLFDTPVHQLLSASRAYTIQIEFISLQDPEGENDFLQHKINEQLREIRFLILHVVDGFPKWIPFRNYFQIIYSWAGNKVKNLPLFVLYLYNWIWDIGWHIAWIMCIWLPIYLFWSILHESKAGRPPSSSFDNMFKLHNDQHAILGLASFYYFLWIIIAYLVSIKKDHEVPTELVLFGSFSLFLTASHLLTTTTLAFHPWIAQYFGFVIFLLNALMTACILLLASPSHLYFWLDLIALIFSGAILLLYLSNMLERYLLRWVARFLFIFLTLGWVIVALRYLYPHYVYVIPV